MLLDHLALRSTFLVELDPTDTLCRQTVVTLRLPFIASRRRHCLDWQVPPTTRWCSCCGGPRKGATLAVVPSSRACYVCPCSRAFHIASARGFRCSQTDSSRRRR